MSATDLLTSGSFTSDLTGAISGATGAAADLAAASGYDAEAAAYAEAANLAGQDVGLQKTSTAIQTEQTQRQINMAIGTTQSDVAGAGFAETGSSLDIISNEQEQGRLQVGLLQTQGQINEISYEEQQAAYTGESQQATATADAARAGAAGSALKGAVGILGAVASIFKFL